MPDLIPYPTVATFHDGVDVVNIGNIAVIEELTCWTLDTAFRAIYQRLGGDERAGRPSSPPHELGHHALAFGPCPRLAVRLSPLLLLSLRLYEIRLFDLGIVPDGDLQGASHDLRQLIDRVSLGNQGPDRPIMAEGHRADILIACRPAYLLD